MSTIKTICIKSINKPRYSVAMLQAEESGLYYVTYEAQGDKEPSVTESMLDYRVATDVFDEIVVKLEGN